MNVNSIYNNNSGTTTNSNDFNNKENLHMSAEAHQ
jgi:hypothetical protein